MPTPQQLALAQDAQQRIRAYNEMLRKRNQLSQDLATLGPEGQQAMQEYQYSQVAPETAAGASMNFPEPITRPEAPIRADYEVNKYGQVSFDAEIDQAAVDQTFAQRFPIEMQATQRYRPDLMASQVPEHSMNRIIERTGWYPSSEWMEANIPNWEERRDIDFYSISNQLSRSPDFRDALQAANPGMQGPAFENFVNVMSYISASDSLNGYMPEAIRSYTQEFAAPQMEGLNRYLAPMGKNIQNATPQELAQAAAAMKSETLEMAMRKTQATEAGRQSMVPSEPISGKEALDIGIDPSTVPGGTYYGFAQQTGGARTPSQTEITNRQQFRPVFQRMQDLNRLLFGQKDAQGNFLEEGIFTGIESGTLPRTLARGSAYWEQFKGTDRGEKIEQYNDTMAFIARQLLQLAGEKGSRFSDQDVEAIMASAPEITWRKMDSESLAQRKMQTFLKGMQYIQQAMESGTYFNDLPGVTEWRNDAKAMATIESQQPDEATQNALDEFKKRSQ